MRNEYLLATLFVAQEFVCAEKRFILIHDGHDIANLAINFKARE